jgi:NAD(P)-dependent dehydrogenase (short-subunit alcohol dehydrogenase family)
VSPFLRRALERLLFPMVRLDEARLRQRLAGRTILVTGASFGIGEGVARIAAAHGARVLLVARTADRLEALAGEIRAAGGEALAFPADLTDPAAVAALAPLVDAQRPDVLVSNAGKSIRRPLFESLDRFHDISRTIGVNYLGPAQLALALIPGLVERGGQIVSISAANVLLPPAPRWAAYQASKAAFDQWLRSASPELRARGVAVTRIYLPLVRTRMIAPTEIYREVPAMAPEQASRLVLRTILTRQRRWTPWWLPPAAAGAATFRALFEVLAERHERRASRR